MPMLNLIIVLQVIILVAIAIEKASSIFWGNKRIDALKEQINALETHIRYLKELTPEILIKQSQALRENLNQIVGDLEAKLEKAHSEIVERNNRIISLEQLSSNKVDDIKKLEREKLGWEASAKKLEGEIESLKKALNSSIQMPVFDTSPYTELFKNSVIFGDETRKALSAAFDTSKTASLWASVFSSGWKNTEPTLLGGATIVDPQNLPKNKELDRKS